MPWNQNWDIPVIRTRQGRGLAPQGDVSRQIFAFAGKNYGFQGQYPDGSQKSLITGFCGALICFQKFRFYYLETDELRGKTQHFPIYWGFLGEAIAIWKVQNYQPSDLYSWHVWKNAEWHCLNVWLHLQKDPRRIEGTWVCSGSDILNQLEGIFPKPEDLCQRTVACSIGSHHPARMSWSIKLKRGISVLFFLRRTRTEQPNPGERPLCIIIHVWQSFWAGTGTKETIAGSVAWYLEIPWWPEEQTGEFRDEILLQWCIVNQAAHICIWKDNIKSEKDRMQMICGIQAENL